MSRLSLLVLIFTSAARAEDWPVFRKDAARSGTDGSKAPATAAILWKWKAPQRVCSSPAIADGTIFIGSDDDALHALDAETGKVRWTFHTRHQVFSSPSVAGGRVYFGEGLHHNNDACLYCVDAKTGKLLWKFKTTGHVECTPSIVDGRVYFGAGDDGMYCVNAETGEKIWQSKGLHVDTAPLVAEGLVISGSGYGDHAVMAWKADTGEQAWKTKMPACSWGAPAVGPKGLILGTGNGNFEFSDANPKAEIVCLSFADGKAVWRSPMKNAALAATAVVNGRAYLGNRGGQFGCWDAETGKLLWESGCGSPILSSAAIAENAVVFGCDGGHVHAVDPATGKQVWKHDTKTGLYARDRRIISSPIIAGSRIYVGSNSGEVFCLGESK